MDKTKMLKELRATRFPKNKGRTNILNKGQTYSLSMVLGKVRQLYSSCNGKVCKVASKWNKKYPELLKGEQGTAQTARPQVSVRGSDD